MDETKNTKVEATCLNCYHHIYDDRLGEYKCKKKTRVCSLSEVKMGCSDWKKLGSKPDDPKPELVVRSGATFTPHVSADGVLSWTNDKGLPDPKPVELTKGLNGKDGVDGKDGKDGYTPVKGVDYFDGVDGKDGYTPVKGVDYFDGVNGKDGKDGYTPVKGVDYFDGAHGKDGTNGVNGNDGYTPIKGVDYFTEADKSEMTASVIAALPKYNGEVIE